LVSVTGSPSPFAGMASAEALAGKNDQIIAKKVARRLPVNFAGGVLLMVVTSDSCGMWDIIRWVD
jgi:hypothetical protein